METKQALLLCATDRGLDGQPLASSPANRHASLANLPPELVLHIFYLMFEDARKPPRWHHRVRHSDAPATYSDAECTWESVCNPRELNFFPYNVSGTCEKWLAISSMVGSFWTRMIVFVGSNATPIPLVEKRLKASRDLILDEVMVIRHNDCIAEDPLERDLVTGFTKLIAPHVHRIKELTFEVLHADSLTTPRCDLGGDAEILRVLKLEAKHGPLCVLPRAMGNAIVFHFGALRHLAVDAETFFDSFTGKMRPLRTLTELVSIRLWVRPVGSAPGRNRRFSFRQFVHSLPKDPGRFLESLDLDGVALAPLVRDLTERLEISSALTLKSMNAKSVAAVLKNSSLPLTDSIHISSCDLPGISEPIHAYSFAVDGITVHENLIPFLRCMNATQWRIERCPALTDSRLLELNHDSSEVNDLTSADLIYLYIQNCPNLTVTGIRRFVEGRLAAYERHKIVEEGVQVDEELDNYEQPVSKITNLDVLGCGLGTAEDVVWLRVNVHHCKIEGWPETFDGKPAEEYFAELDRDLSEPEPDVDLEDMDGGTN